MKKIAGLVAILIIGFLIGLYFIPNELAPCSFLPRSVCDMLNNCQTYSGPSACNGNICTADIVDKGCRTKPYKAIAEYEAKNEMQRKECARYGARFDIVQYRCECDVIYPESADDLIQFLNNGGPQEYIEKAGCKTPKELCENSGGNWSIDVQPTKITLTDDVTKEKCENRTISCTQYSDENNSYCFSKWNEDMNKCQIKAYNTYDMYNRCQVNGKIKYNSALFWDERGKLN